jgi:hypothetical protein
MLRCFAGHRRRRQLDVVHAVGKRADLDLRHAWYNIRGSNRYQQRIRPGFALKEDIGTADMSCGRRCQGSGK